LRGRPRFVPTASSSMQGRKRKRELCIDNLLVRIHFIIVMIRWTGLAPWEFEFPFPSSFTSTFLKLQHAEQVSNAGGLRPLLRLRTE